MLLFFLEIIYPRIPGALAPQDFLNTTLPEDVLSLYAKYLVNLCIWTGGILALGGLIYGGILYLISTGKPERMSSAKNQISGAFFGLLILLSSYLILKTLSPQFINLKIPTLQTVQIPVKPDVPLPETTAINSSIDVEMPFSRIIENLFETYISDYPKPEEEKIPRMTRIKNIAETTKEITNKLLNQSENLKNAADECSCRQTDPEQPCGNNKSGNTTWKCSCGGCSATKPCTCDPCSDVRGEIQDNENKNKAEINNLSIKNTETEQEVRLLEEELDRLKRAEKFIKECPLRSLRSLLQFYNKKDSYDNQGWTLKSINFWDDVNIRYYLPNIYGKASIMTDNDFATFYCSVSGTMEQKEVFPVSVPDADKLTGEESVEEAEEVFSESMTCSKETPVGEIIDRAKRTTQLLINKLELLVEKNKELTDAVDKLQVLVSQCSSKRGCERRCACFHCGCGHDPCIDLCQGWTYCCADSSGNYPSICKERDKDTPCPYEEIEDQLKEIQRIQQEIKDIIDGKDSNDTISNIGIITIIDEISPEIIEDLAKNIRYVMKHYDELFNCSQAKGAIIPPNNAILRICCKTENSAYGDCFEECYLEIGQDKHRECVQKCLNKKAQELNDPEIAQCVHELNFYICETK